MGTNWANTAGCTPGNDRAVKLQKSIAMGTPAPASKRVVKVELKGSSSGCTKAPGLTNR